MLPIERLGTHTSGDHTSAKGSPGAVREKNRRPQISLPRMDRQLRGYASAAQATAKTISFASCAAAGLTGSFAGVYFTGAGRHHCHPGECHSPRRSRVGRFRHLHAET